jgi:mannose-6-phosphate isomerase-like protein (cupin superfamily)
MRTRHSLTWILLAGLLAVPSLALLMAQGPETVQPTYIAGDRTQAAFATGAPLVETAAFKVHASRREASGMAEVHTLDTDIIYVLDGAATVVTGGTVVARTDVAPNEIRGASIEGGTTRQLAKGDLFIVPNGVPHWFKDVQAPFLYYVVKTTTMTAAGGAE